MGEVSMSSKNKTASVASTFFSLLFQAQFSEKEKKAVFVDRNKEVLGGWSAGKTPLSGELQNKRKNPESNVNDRLAGHAAVKQLIADLMFQVVVNCRQKGRMPLPWIVLITQILQDARVPKKTMDFFCSMGLCHCRATCLKDIDPDSLQTFYDSYFGELQKYIKFRDPYSILVLLNIDNLNHNEYSQVPGEGKKICYNVDSSSAQVLPVEATEEYIARRMRFDSNEEPYVRASAVMSAENFLTSMASLEQGSFDTRGLLKDYVDPRHMSQSNFYVIPSVPVKSSREDENYSLQLMFSTMWPGKEFLSNGDIEYSTQNAKFASLGIPNDAVTNVFQVLSMFHILKHVNEVCNSSPVFMLLIYAVVANFMNVKECFKLAPKKILSLFTPEEVTAYNTTGRLPWDPRAPGFELVDVNDDAGIAEADRERGGGQADEDRGRTDEEIAEDMARRLAAGPPLVDPTAVDVPFLSTVGLLVCLHYGMRPFQARHKQEEIDYNLRKAAHKLANIGVTPKVKWPEPDFKKSAVPKRLTVLLAASKALLKELRTNLRRLKFIMGAISAAWGFLVPRLRGENLLVSPLAKLVGRFMDGPIHLCTEPFRLINVEGKCELLYTSLPKICRLVLWGGKWKVFRALFALLINAEHQFSCRPEIVPMIAQNCRSVLQEVSVELLNSLIIRMLESLGATVSEFQQMRNASVMLLKHREVLKAMDIIAQRERKLGPVGPAADGNADGAPARDTQSMLKKRAITVESKKANGEFVTIGAGCAERGCGEITKQDLTFMPGGTSYSYVLRIADHCLYPLMKSYAAHPAIPPHVATAFNLYDPLSDAEIPIMRDAVDAYQAALATARKTELALATAALVAPVAAPIVAVPAPVLLGPFELFAKPQLNRTLYWLIQKLQQRVPVALPPPFPVSPKSVKSVSVLSFHSLLNLYYCFVTYNIHCRF